MNCTSSFMFSWNDDLDFQGCGKKERPSFSSYFPILSASKCVSVCTQWTGTAAFHFSQELPHRCRFQILDTKEGFFHSLQNIAEFFCHKSITISSFFFIFSAWNPKGNTSRFSNAQSSPEGQCRELFARVYVGTTKKWGSALPPRSLWGELDLSDINSIKRCEW